MALQQNHMQASIKREITKLYKTSFGKGPESTEVIIYDKFVFLKFVGAFSQIEETLMNSENGRGIVEKIREELILVRTSIYVPTVEKIVNGEMKKVTYILEEENNTIYVFILFANVIEKE